MRGWVFFIMRFVVLSLLEGWMNADSRFPDYMRLAPGTVFVQAKITLYSTPKRIIALPPTPYMTLPTHLFCSRSDPPVAAECLSSSHRLRQ